MYTDLEFAIGGDKLTTRGRNSSPVLNPATGEEFARLPHATSADLDRALEISAKAFKVWRRTLAVDRADVVGEGNVKVLQSHTGRALKTTHVGSYDELGTTYERLAAWLQANGYEMAGPSFAFYLDDPAKTAEAVLRTEIYWPVK